MPPKKKAIAKQQQPGDAAKDADAKGLLASQRPRAKSAPSRFLGRRNTEEQATRAIQSQCGNISKDALAFTKVDGKSVLDQVMEDKRAARPERKKLGPGYWAGIKQKYSLGSTLTLQPKSKDEAIDENLLHALSLARSTVLSQKSNTALSSFLSGVVALNNRELTGIANHISSLRPFASEASMQLIIQFMRTILRLDLVKDNMDIMTALKEKFDEALQASLQIMLKQGVDEGVWWEAHGDVAGLILDQASASRVMAEKNEWGPVSQLISGLVASSGLGKMLFGFASEQLTSEKMSKAICTCFTHVEKTTKVDLGAEAALQSAFDKAVKTHGARKLVSQKRAIEVEYRGTKVTVHISSVDQEFECRKGAWIKSLASPHQLQALPFEDGGWLANAPSGAVVDEKVLQPYTRARTVDWLTKNLQSIVSLDGSFLVELELMKMMQGKEGEKVMQNRVLTTLPQLGQHTAYELGSAIPKQFCKTLNLPTISKDAIFGPAS